VADTIRNNAENAVSNFTEKEEKARLSQKIPQSH
jgi:hypothetical protein